MMDVAKESGPLWAAALALITASIWFSKQLLKFTIATVNNHLAHQTAVLGKVADQLAAIDTRFQVWTGRASDDHNDQRDALQAMGEGIRELLGRGK